MNEVPMPAAFTHLDWPRLRRDFLCTRLSLREYFNSPRFHQLCQGKLPSFSTLKEHFSRLAQQERAVVPNLAIQSATPKEVSVVSLSQRQIESALHSHGDAKTAQRRFTTEEKPVCIRFPGGAVMEFFTASPELLALQALRAAAGDAS